MDEFNPLDMAASLWDDAPPIGEQLPTPGKSNRPDEYNADGTRKPFDEGAAPTLRHAAAVRTHRRLGREDAAAKQIGPLPGPGEEILTIMTGQWHGWDLVGAIASLAGCPIAQLHVASLGFNKGQSEDLGRMIDAGTIQRCAFLISTFFHNSNPVEWHHLKTTLETRGQRLAHGMNHAKLLCFEMFDGRRYVCHGSLNLRRCNAWEQVAISADPETHGFFAGWIDEVLARHGA